MNPVASRFLPFAWIACFAACSGVPAKVVQVDSPAAPANGLRYVLKRPSYAVFLHYKGDLEGAHVFDLVLEQKLVDGQTYEVQSSASLLQDTELTLGFAGDGRLAAFTAGAADRTGDAITSAVRLVAALGSIALLDVPPADLPGPAAEYVRRHQAMVDEKKRLSADLAALAGKFGNSEAPDVLNPRLKAVTDLEARIASLDEKLKAHRLPVPKDKLRLTVGDVALIESADPWVTVTLEKLR